MEVGFLRIFKEDCEKEKPQEAVSFYTLRFVQIEFQAHTIFFANELCYTVTSR